MFSHRVYLTNTCLAAFDLAVTAASYAAVRYAGLSSGENASLGAALLLWLSLSCYFGMYRSRRLDSPLADVTVIFKVALATWMLGPLAHALLPTLRLTEVLSLPFILVNVVTLAATRSGLRLLLRDLRRRGYNVKRLVLIAGEDAGERLARKIADRSYYGYRVAARLVYRGEIEEAPGKLDNFVDQTREVLRAVAVDDVILALPVNANALGARLVAECENHGVNVRIVPDLFPLIQTDTQIHDFDGIPLVNAHLYPTESLGYVVVKRTFDLGVSLFVLFLFSPLFVGLAALIKFTSEGPVFFTQERVGMNGKTFRIIKFRTMRPAPSLDPDSHWTVKDDEHITPLGRWLRRTNLDELPQFINVLRGEMSVVGPRPERPFFLRQFRQQVPEYMARQYVKSGITGWAQVNGWRGDTAIPQRVAHDLYYIRNWAVSFDIKILCLTLARTLFPTVSLNESKHGSSRS